MRRMLKSTLAIGLAGWLDTEVDSSIRRYRARFCIDRAPSVFDRSLRAALPYQIEPVPGTNPFWQVHPVQDRMTYNIVDYMKGLVWMNSTVTGPI